MESIRVPARRRLTNDKSSSAGIEICANLAFTSHHDLHSTTTAREGRGRTRRKLTAKLIPLLEVSSRCAKLQTSSPANFENAAMQVLLWRSRLLVFCLVIIQLGCSWWTGPYGCREFHFWPFFLSSHWKASVDLRIRTLMSVGNIRSSSEWKWNRLKSLIACLRKGPIFAILLVLVPRKRFFF